MPMTISCQQAEVLKEPAKLTSPTPRIIDVEAELNRKKWDTSGFSDYDMEIDGYFGNGIGGPASAVKISVRKGATTSIISRRVEDTRPVEEYKHVETVEKIFQYLQDLREQALNSGKVDAMGNSYPSVTVEYNRLLGYPTRIMITWSSAVDANSTFVVKKLSPYDNQ